MSVILSLIAKCLILFTLTFLARNSLGQDIDSLFSAETSLDESLQTVLKDRPLLLQNTKAKIRSKIDSVNEIVLHDVENEVVSLNQRLDSLKTLKLPLDEYQAKADSLYHSFRAKLLHRYKLPIDTLSQKINNRINGLDEKLKKKTFVIDSIFAANGLDMNWTLSEKIHPSLPQEKLSKINPSSLDIPAPNNWEYGIPTTADEHLSQIDPHLPQVNSAASLPAHGDLNITQVDISKTEDIAAMDGIKSVQEKISEVTDAAKDTESYAKELEKVKELNVEDMEKIPQAAEKQLLKIDGADAVKDELDRGEALKKQVEGFADEAKDTEEMKEKVLHRTKQPFVDHLKGKDEKVKAGMSKMFEYQKKYRVVADTRYLPKRTANKLKGKPWQERVVPGVAFQINRNHVPWTGIGISPFVGYRLSGRFRTFIGATYTPYVNIKTFDFNSADRAFAFRGFAHVKIINGIYLHLEAEGKREYLSLKPAHQGVTDQVFNQWQKNYYVGLMRLQRLNKKVNASFYVLYDVAHIGEIFNVTQLEMRFGFEYKLKKKKKLPAGK